MDPHKLRHLENAAQDDVERRRKLLAFYDTIVFVSENARRSFLKHFPEYSDKCIVIHNFVDSDRIRAMAGEPVEEDYFIRRSDDQLNVVLVGRLEPEKAFHRMLDAARILKQDGLEINWLILGKGYEYDSLIHKKEQYGLDNVHFLGFRKNPYAYMRAADIVGALSEYEGFSLTIVESLPVGNPCHFNTLRRCDGNGRKLWLGHSQRYIFHSPRDGRSLQQPTVAGRKKACFKHLYI